MENVFRNFYFSNQVGFNIFFLVLSLWSLFWKGLALWRSSQNKEKKWFIALLIINLAGILEIIYLLRFSKKKFDLNEVIVQTGKLLKNPAAW